MVVREWNGRVRRTTSFTFLTPKIIAGRWRLSAPRSTAQLSERGGFVLQTASFFILSTVTKFPYRVITFEIRKVGDSRVGFWIV